MPLPEVHNKMTMINGRTLQQPFFEHVGKVRLHRCTCRARAKERKERGNYAGSRTPPASINGDTLFRSNECQTPTRDREKKYTWKTPPKLPHSKDRGKKTRHTHPLKQAPSTQPRPISLPTRQKRKSKHRRIQQRSKPAEPCSAT